MNLLRVHAREAVLVEDCELIHCLLPVARRTAPIGGDVTQRQLDEFTCRLIGGEMPARLVDLAQPRIHALNH